MPRLASQPRLRATLIGPVAARCLRAGAKGEVRAVFARSFYVSLGPQWICIGMPALGAGPLNILCTPSGDDPFPTTMLRAGDAAAIHGDALVAGGTAIMLAGAARWSPEPPRPWSRRCLLQGLAALADALPQALPEEGLARLLRPGTAVSSTPVLRAAQAPACDLVRIVHAAHAAQTIDGRCLTPLLGLGPGLTPSGDDYLGGALVALHATGQAELGARLWEELEPQLAVATGDISRAHVSAAAEGLGHAALHDLIGAILVGTGESVRNALRAATSIGHTSGWDAVAGAVAVLRATATT
jgi:hypothetical protein